MASPLSQSSFDAIDINHDGVITREEFGRAVSGSVPAPPAKCSGPAAMLLHHAVNSLAPMVTHVRTSSPVRCQGGSPLRAASWIPAGAHPMGNEARVLHPARVRENPVVGTPSHVLVGPPQGITKAELEGRLEEERAVWSQSMRDSYRVQTQLLEELIVQRSGDFHDHAKIEDLAHKCEKMQDRVDKLAAEVPVLDVVHRAQQLMVSQLAELSQELVAVQESNISDAVAEKEALGALAKNKEEMENMQNQQLLALNAIASMQEQHRDLQVDVERLRGENIAHIAKSQRQQDDDIQGFQAQCEAFRRELAEIVAYMREERAQRMGTMEAQAARQHRAEEALHQNASVPFVIENLRSRLEDIDQKHKHFNDRLVDELEVRISNVADLDTLQGLIVDAVQTERDARDQQSRHLEALARDALEKAEKTTVTFYQEAKEMRLKFVDQPRLEAMLLEALRPTCEMQEVMAGALKAFQEKVKENEAKLSEALQPVQQAQEVLARRLEALRDQVRSWDTEVKELAVNQVELETLCAKRHTQNGDAIAAVRSQIWKRMEEEQTQRQQWLNEFCLELTSALKAEREERIIENCTQRQEIAKAIGAWHTRGAAFTLALETEH